MGIVANIHLHNVVKVTAESAVLHPRGTESVVSLTIRAETSGGEATTITLFLPAGDAAYAAAIVSGISAA